MAEALADQIMRKLKQADESYHRLMLVVAPAGAGKTTALQDVKERVDVSLINVNMDLSRRMLDLTDRQRALQLPRLLREILNDAEGEVVLFDNIEILFDVSLKQDPLRLLQGLSRNKTVVAAWNGKIISDVRKRKVMSGGQQSFDSSLVPHPSPLYLIYAVPDHPEYRRYRVRDFLVASPKFSAED